MIANETVSIRFPAFCGDAAFGAFTRDTTPPILRISNKKFNFAASPALHHTSWGGHHGLL
jgi:hypothetical protein